MQNKGNSNTHNWRQRLDDFEECDQVELETSWQKLQQKVPGSRNIRAGWYWMAAACLLAAAFLLINFRGNNLVRQPDADFITRQESDTAINNHMQAPARVISSEKNIVVKTLPAARKIQSDPMPRIQTTDSKEVVSRSIPSELAQYVLSADTPLLLKEPIITTTKKLRVVHLNELNTSLNTGITREEGKPYFPVNQPSQEVFTNNSQERPSGTGRNSIVKIRLN